MIRVTGMVFATVIVAASICGASEASQQQSDPELNFEYLWREFDERYGIFIPKRIDWDLLYEVYRPKVTPEMTDDELFEVMSNMLENLNDIHVDLESQEPARSFRSGLSLDDVVRRFGSYESFLELFETRPAPDSYFREGLQETDGGLFAYGWIGENIGYFHFNRFDDPDLSPAAVDGIVEHFGDADALIIDVRRNSGGNDIVGKAIADRFADRKRLYLMTQTRNGPDHDDFAESHQWYVEPGGPAQFTKPVVLLIDGTSVSAAENFALAMRTLPHVTLVGCNTAGCFADAEAHVLPNGWKFSVSFKLFVDQDGFCWEGIGIPPDLRIANRVEDREAGRDRQLEFALDLARSGALKPLERMWRYPIDPAE